MIYQVQKTSIDWVIYYSDDVAVALDRWLAKRKMEESQPENKEAFERNISFPHEVAIKALYNLMFY